MFVLGRGQLFINSGQLLIDLAKKGIVELKYLSVLHLVSSNRPEGFLRSSRSEFLKGNR